MLVLVNLIDRSHERLVENGACCLVGEGFRDQTCMFKKFDEVFNGHVLRIARLSVLVAVVLEDLVKELKMCLNEVVDVLVEVLLLAPGLGFDLVVCRG